MKYLIIAILSACSMSPALAQDGPTPAAQLRASQIAEGNCIQERDGDVARLVDLAAENQKLTAEVKTLGAKVDSLEHKGKKK